MKITRITVWQLDLPLHKPYFLSGGRLRFERLDSTLVKIDTDQGISGWGCGLARKWLVSIRLRARGFETSRVVLPHRICPASVWNPR